MNTTYLATSIDNMISKHGGNEITAAMIVCEWYPDMFRYDEFEKARYVLKRKGIIVPAYRAEPVRLDRVKARQPPGTRDHPRSKFIPFTSEEREYILKNWLTRDNISLGIRIGKTESQIRYYAKIVLCLPDKRLVENMKKKQKNGA